MAAGMITAALGVRRVRRMVFAAWIAVELILRPTEPEHSAQPAIYTIAPALDPGRSMTITEPLEVSAIRSPIADSAILVRATECAPVRSVTSTSAERREAF